MFNDAVLYRDTHGIVGSLNVTAIVYTSGPGVAYGLNLIGEAYTRMLVSFFWFCYSVAMVCPGKLEFIRVVQSPDNT